METMGTTYGKRARTLGRHHAEVLYPRIAELLRWATDETARQFWTDYDRERHAPTQGDSK